MSNLEAISQAVQEGNDKKTVELVQEALTGGTVAMDILEKGLVHMLLPQQLS